MADYQACYKVYVVRYWEEQDAQTDTSICRFTLEIPRTGQRIGFTSSDALIKVLECKLNQTSPGKNC